MSAMKGGVIVYNETQKKATAKYMKANLDDIKIRVKKGERARLKNIAAERGLSLNQLFLIALDYYLSHND